MATLRTFTLGTAIALAMTLSACGSKSEKEVASGTYTDPETGKTADYKVTSDTSGENGTISIKTEDGEMQFGGGAGNAKFPAGFSPYPGAKVTGGFTATNKDGAGGMASFEVKGQAADVIAHFRKQAEAAGMKITTEVKAGETAMFGAERPDDSKSGVQVTATQAGDMVNGSITYGHGG